MALCVGRSFSIDPWSGDAAARTGNVSTIVYETQHWTNPEIRNYVDALYFTVTALTTTGFGGITLRG